MLFFFTPILTRCFFFRHECRAYHTLDASLMLDAAATPFLMPTDIDFRCCYAYYFRAALARFR